MTEFGRKHDEGENRSPGGLLRECGRKLTDTALWQEFTDRFQRMIFLFLLRALRQRRFEGDAVHAAADLTQDVYTRLVKNGAHLLQSFKGETEASVAAFLGKITVGVATDFVRRESAERRQGGQVIPIHALKDSDDWHPEADFDLNAILSWIDVQRLLEAEQDQRHAARNVLVFKLRYLDGLTIPDIAAHPGIGLTADGVEKVLQRMRARIRGNFES
jgi:RNA polymerase sigma factor (sigma-70 family)